MTERPTEPPAPAGEPIRDEDATALRALARSHGFDRVGFAPAGPYPEARHFFDWLAAGHHGQMDYLARDAGLRADPTRRRPWVRSFVALAVDYDTEHPRSVDVPDDPERGWISRYAWGRDYHDVLEKRLRALVRELEVHPTLRGRYHYTVDHGPVLERMVAARAGLGFVGKNCMLIHPDAGSYFFLAMLLTDRLLPADAPVADHCGSCTRCLDACPTDAFIAPRILDARRCISYLTIETQEAIPPEHSEPVGFHVFGCDICQDVCPYNRWSPTTADPDFAPRPGLVHPRLDELARDDEAAFRARFAKNPVKRRKFVGFQLSLANARGRRGRDNLPNAARVRGLAPTRRRPPLRRGKRRPPKNSAPPSCAPQAPDV